MFYQYNREIQIIHNQRIFFEAHLHRETEIIAMFRGTAEVTVGGRTFGLSRGDFAFIAPYVMHSYSWGENVDVGKFIFPLHDGGEENAQPLRLRSPIVERARIEKTNLMSLAREIIAERDRVSPAVKRAYLALLAARLLDLCDREETEAGSDSLITEVLTYCRENCDRDISLSDVADGVHVSRSYLSHLFGRRIGMNFRQYINALRVDRAEVLLRGGMRVTEVAAQCGFGSLRTFNRAFARQTGVCPRGYRDAKKNGENSTAG